MFDPFDGVLSKMARRRLLAGWQGVFRAVVLKLLPVRELSQHFSADLGCPTKELYSMAGLVFLADLLELDVAKQQLDSTYVFSHSPLHVTRDETTQTTVVEMSAASCASCPLLQLCPIACGPDGRFELEFTDQARRTSARRVEAGTSVFRERYAERSGIESTNSGLKNRLDMGWLPVRGRAAVFRTILLKVSGWNVLRASASGKLRAMVQAAVAKLLGAGWAWPFGQARVVRYSPEIRSTRPQIEIVQKHFRPTSPRTATIFRLSTPLTA